MLPKKGITPQGYYDYTVYPLEGIWDLKDKAKYNKTFDKDSLIYTIMIRQPDFLDEDLAKDAIENIRIQKKNDEIGEVYFEKLKEGLYDEILGGAI
jgi:hypothetical protein